MQIIGVTGGIGAGKTTVSAILKEMGAEVIDADHISRKVTQPGEPAWKEIIDYFGQEVVLPDETIDRKKLASMVFNSEEKRRKLEAIIHARVIHEMEKRISTLREAGYDGIVVLDVPIPVRRGFLDIVDAVWVVVCPEEERIRRIMARSGMDRAEAESRIRSQLPQEEYIRLADAVIENNGDLETLRQKIAGLLSGYI
ncbi:MAG TPA: dephospho-CoA kinase [Thermoclostridium sp.]|nr:dephospho-CoA kinase [Thermoclostridium sp.]HPU44958.1 dephospho-CoA kinase [Thermoclostridium sp.]